MTKGLNINTPKGLSLDDPAQAEEPRTNELYEYYDCMEKLNILVADLQKKLGDRSPLTRRMVGIRDQLEGAMIEATSLDPEADEGTDGSYCQVWPPSA